MVLDKIYLSFKDSRPLFESRNKYSVEMRVSVKLTNLTLKLWTKQGIRMINVLLVFVQNYLFCLKQHNEIPHPMQSSTLMEMVLFDLIQ